MSTHSILYIISYIILYICVFLQTVISSVFSICIYTYIYYYNTINNIYIYINHIQSFGVLQQHARKATHRICVKAGITPCENLRPGKHLPFNHPSVQRVRVWVNMEIQKRRFNARLVCNFDQVWTMAFRPKKSVLLYRGEKDELSKFPGKKKLRHCFERCLSGNFTESYDDNGVYVPSEPQVSGGFAACNPPDGFRNPHTLTTLSWSDGSVGRGFVTVRDDAFGEKQRESINKVCIYGIYFGYIPICSRNV